MWARAFDMMNRMTIGYLRERHAVVVEGSVGGDLPAAVQALLAEPLALQRVLAAGGSPEKACLPRPPAGPWSGAAGRQVLVQVGQQGYIAASEEQYNRGKVSLTSPRSCTKDDGGTRP
jgi:hypothetical protein